MADTAQAIAKVTEIASNIKSLAENFKKSTGNSQFTLSQIIPDWGSMDDRLRELIGLEFKDRIAKKGIDGVEQVGKSEDGSDLYEVK